MASRWLAAVVATAVGTSGLPDADVAFASFIERFGKDYGPEFETRRAIFAESLALIERENAKGHLFTLGVTPFADLTGEEFLAKYTGLGSGARPNSTLGVHVYRGGDLADSVDWTKKGAVTPVKNQGECGSCWTFSSTGAVEGAWQIASGKLMSLSEQQLLDCSGLRYFNYGCKGGLPVHAFSYYEGYAACSESDYPYMGKTSWTTSCKASSCAMPALPAGALIGYKSTEQTEQSLMEALMQQPVSVTLDAEESMFKLYEHGIVHGPGCGTVQNHAVLAVGYGTSGGRKYWKVKNSWSSGWGERGYVRIIRGVDECGILDGPPAYPVVKASPPPTDVDQLVI